VTGTTFPYDISYHPK